MGLVKCVRARRAPAPARGRKDPPDVSRSRPPVLRFTPSGSWRPSRSVEPVPHPRVEICRDRGTRCRPPCPSSPSPPSSGTVDGCPPGGGHPGRGVRLRHLQGEHHCLRRHQHHGQGRVRRVELHGLRRLPQEERRHPAGRLRQPAPGRRRGAHRHVPTWRLPGRGLHLPQQPGLPEGAAGLRQPAAQERLGRSGRRRQQRLPGLRQLHELARDHAAGAGRGTASSSTSSTAPATTVDTSSPQYQAAYGVCKALLPTPGSSTSTTTAAVG